MYLFFDTETNGLPSSYKSSPQNFQNWPRIVQLAFILCDADGNEIESYSEIIKATDFKIPLNAWRVHGITEQISLKDGIPEKDVLSVFAAALLKAKQLVAHNLEFDRKVVSAAFYRSKADPENFVASRIEKHNGRCTMHLSTQFCNLPGRLGYKWPKLVELHDILFNEPFANAHDALADVKATKRCFFELVKRGVIRV
jgi:DNA polymerase-3 subunit epsilon